MTAALLPVFGVEPYDPSNDGAILTMQNLVISAWRIESDGSYTRVPLIPDSYISAGFKNVSVGENLFSSRQSARLLLNFQEEGAEPWEADILLVLNPPPELVQLTTDPDHLASYDATTGVVDFNLQQNLLFGGALAWSAAWFDVSLFPWGMINVPPVSPANVEGGFGNPTGMPLPVPPLKTNGADGQPPEFYSPTSYPVLVDILNAIKKGARYYIPFFCQISSDTPDYTVGLDLRWQFSGASRS